MKFTPKLSREQKKRLLRDFAVGLTVALVLGALWLFLKPEGSWRYYTDGISIRRAAADAPVRYVLWEDPELVPGDFNQAADTYEPCISADGRKMIFTRGRVQDNADLFECEWDGADWGEPSPLESLNTDRDELGPALSRDGRYLYFYSDREGGQGGYDIWVARREENGWTAATNAGSEVNSMFNEYGPALSPGGDRLFFSSNRPRRQITEEEKRAWKATLREVTLQTDYDIFSAAILPDAQTDAAATNATAVAPAAPPVFGEVARVAELNSMHDEGQVVITPRGDFLYFSSNREGGKGGFDIYRSRLIHGAILPPENLGSPVNTSFNEMDPALRLEGFGLVFSSNREQEDPLDYRLYGTASRDVVSRYNLSHWRLLWWSLSRVKWWLLIIVAALLLLMYLIRTLANVELRRKRSLLHTCLLASALIHALILFLLGFWIISAQVIKQMSEPAMELAVDLDALARERISLDIREDITELPSSSDVLVVEQAERRMPIPELTPPEPSMQPIVAQAAMERFDFEAPREPEPLEREVEEMEAARVVENLPELELRPPEPMMMEQPAPKQEREAELPELAAPSTKVARAEPAPPSPPPVPAAVQPPPAPAVPVERSSFVPPAEAEPAPVEKIEPLERLTEALAQMPAVETRPTEMRMDEPAEVKTATEPELKTSLDAPAAAAPARRTPPVPEGPIAAEVKAPETITDDAMVSAVASEDAVEAETSSTLLPADQLYTNLSVMELAADISMEQARPESMETEVAELRLAALAGAGENAPVAAQLFEGRPEAVEAKPLPSEARKATPAVEETPAPRAVEASTQPESLARPSAVATNLPAIAVAANLPLETATPRSAAGEAAEARLVADSSHTQKRETVPAAAGRPEEAEVDAPNRPTPVMPSDIPAQPAAAVEADAPRRDVVAPELLVRELPDFSVTAQVRLEQSKPAGKAESTTEPGLAAEASLAAASSRTQQRETIPAAAGKPEGAAIDAPNRPAPVVAAGQPVAAGEAAAPREAIVQPREFVKELPDFRVAAKVRLERARPSGSSETTAEPGLAADRRQAPRRASGSALDKPSAAVVRAGQTPLPVAPRAASDVVAPSGRTLPLPELNGIGKVATRQLPALEIAATLQLETSELAGAPHYLLRQPESRGQMLESLGADKKSEATVQRALDWFTRHQEPDGHWEMAKYGGEARHEVSATGMALLCYFGWGAKHTEPGPYQVTVMKAIDWLLDQMKENGDLRSKDMYDQGIATMALTEAYGMTKDGRLLEPAGKAVDFIIKAQHPNTGGWRYQPGDPGDTSVFGWQVMALKSAIMAGIEVPPEVMKKADGWLDRVGGGKHKGLYGYQGPSPAPSMVAEGMFCRQLLGHAPEHPTMMESAAYLNTQLPNNLNFYYIYYGTLSLFQHQGPIWETWNDAMRKTLMSSQVNDGEHAGSWNPVGQHGNLMGRVGATAMATLSLEVYYRYLPLYGLHRSSEQP